jgi:hypothetical protein
LLSLLLLLSLSKSTAREFSDYLVIDSGHSRIPRSENRAISENGSVNRGGSKELRGVNAVIKVL